MINKDLKTEIKGIRGGWSEVYRACLNTIGKDVEREPSSEWKRRILVSEHSPIRKINIQAKWSNLWYWVSTHFVRHKYGIEHFISTQRVDRTKENRNQKPQNAPVSHEFDVNPQAIINISRKRLCHCASPETTEAWKEFLKELEKREPELVSVCVKECVYRGFCPEFYSCGYATKKSTYKKYRDEVEQYRKNINGYGSVEQREQEAEYVNSLMSTIGE